MQTRDLERHGIDSKAYEITRPEDVRDRMITQISPPLELMDNSPEARGDIKGRKQVLRSRNCDRHDLFFDLGVLLVRKYRYPLHDAGLELLVAAGNDLKMRKSPRHSQVT